MDLTNCLEIKSGINGIEFNQMALNFLINNGKGNSTEAVELRNTIDKQKKQYSKLGCGKDLKADECINLDSRIQSLINAIAEESKLALYDARKNSSVESMKKKLAELKLEYETKGCLKKVEQVKSATTQQVIGQFTALDEARINEETSYETKQRIFFGGLVLVAGLLILTMFNNKEK